MPDDENANSPESETNDDQTSTPESAEDRVSRLEQENATLKANSRKWEDRSKANKDKADKFDKLQQSSATDADKLRDAVERGDRAERELARYRVAASTGLPADLAEMLTGADEDAMEAQAKRLIARLAPADTGADKRTPPKADKSQGGTPAPKVSQAEMGREEAQRRLASRKTSS